MLFNEDILALVWAGVLAVTVVIFLNFLFWVVKKLGESTFKRILCVPLVALAMFGLVGCESGGYKEQYVVDATVVSKEYEAPRTYTSVVPSGKSVFPITRTIPAKYLVTVTYENIPLTINSQPIYESLENGDSIKVLLIKKYTAEGQLKSSRLEQL